MQRKSAAKQQWVAKGAERAEAAKADEEESEAIKNSPILSAPSTGPSYDKITMLRAFQAAGGQDAAEKALDLAVTDRPTEDAEGGKTPGARRALREAKKAEKIARRMSSGLLDESIEEEAPPQAVETPGGTKVSLASAMGHTMSSEAQAAAMAQYNAAMMQYLNSMAFAAPQMAYAGYTTVMLRNIPNRYTRDMLVERLNESYKQQFDFVYLPIDFNSKCNVGYAFINFRTPQASAMFIQEFHGKKTKTVLPGFTSAKVCEVSYARVQGRDANMDNLRDEKFIEKLNERPEWQPLFLGDDGKEVSFKKILTSSGGKKNGKGGTPMNMPPTPPGYMGGFSPFGMMYPPAFGMAPPPPPTPKGPTTTLANVLPNATADTMLMLKDLPGTVKQEDLINKLDKDYKGDYDFLFIPKDHKGEGNRGFAFVNFRKKEKAEAFTKEYTGVKVSAFYGTEAKAEEEDKACEVAPARLSSLEGSIMRAQTSMSKVAAIARAAWAPSLFSADGAPLPFPLLSTAKGEKGERSPKAKKEKTEEAAEGAEGAKEEKKDETKEGEGGESKEQGEEKKEGKGKGKKGEGKGKTPKTAKTPAGYPGHQPQAYMSHMMAMQKMAMSSMAAQHTAAHAAAAKHAYSSIGGPPASPSKQSRKPLSDDVKHSLKKQVEFYFSLANLCKDVFLRQHMDARTGYVALELLAAFPKVMKLNATATHIAEVLESSETLELDESKTLTRLRGEEERRRWMATQA